MLISTPVMLFHSSDQILIILSTVYFQVCSRTLLELLEDVSINHEYEYENDIKPYSYSKSFSQLSMLAMTPSSSL